MSFCQKSELRVLSFRYLEAIIQNKMRVCESNIKSMEKRFSQYESIGAQYIDRQNAVVVPCFALVLIGDYVGRFGYSYPSIWYSELKVVQVIWVTSNYRNTVPIVDFSLVSQYFGKDLFAELYRETNEVVVQIDYCFYWIKFVAWSFKVIKSLVHSYL